MATELPDGWSALEGTQAEAFEAELARELAPAHSLHAVPLRAVATRDSNDDALFRFAADTDRFAVVHLTWIGRQEDSAHFPAVVFVGTLAEFLAAEAALAAEIDQARA